MGDLQRGKGFGSVNKKLKEGIIKGLTVPMARQAQKRDKEQLLGIEGRLLRGRVFETRMMLLQHSDEELRKLKRGRRLLHHDLRSRTQTMRRGTKLQDLQLIFRIGRGALRIHPLREPGIHLIQDGRTRHRSRFRAHRRDGGGLVVQTTSTPHQVIYLIQNLRGTVPQRLLQAWYLWVRDQGTR